VKRHKPLCKVGNRAPFSALTIIKNTNEAVNQK
jgi:hypothetical protein